VFVFVFVFVFVCTYSCNKLLAKQKKPVTQRRIRFG
jgi:hypothetical protein